MTEYEQSSNIITPQNIQSIFNSNYIPDGKHIYIKYLVGSLNTGENPTIDNLSPETTLKIAVLDMRTYGEFGEFWMVAGKVLSKNNPCEGKVETFYYPRDKFMLNNNINHYICILFAVSKFKILLRRIRNKKNIRLFLLSTTYSPNLLNQLSPLNKFGGSSHLPIRKEISDFIVGNSHAVNA